MYIACKCRSNHSLNISVNVIISFHKDQVHIQWHNKLHHSLSPRWDHPGGSFCHWQHAHIRKIMSCYWVMATLLEGMILEVQLKPLAHSRLCTSAAPRKTWWWHCPAYGWMDTTIVSHAHAHVHTHAHRRRPNPNMSPGTSWWAFKNPVFKLGWVWLIQPHYFTFPTLLTTVTA